MWGQGSIIRGVLAESLHIWGQQTFVCLRHLTQTHVSYLARSPRGVLGSMGSGHQGRGVGPGQHFRNFAESSRSPCTYKSKKNGMLEASHTVTCVILGAESSRSPEVHGLWPPGLFCVARPAFSELRGVLAESGVQRRGVRVSNLPSLCKVFVSFPRPTPD